MQNKCETNVEKVSNTLDIQLPSGCDRVKHRLRRFVGHILAEERGLEQLKLVCPFWHFQRSSSSSLNSSPIRTDRLKFRKEPQYLGNPHYTLCRASQFCNACSSSFGDDRCLPSWTV